MAAFSPPVKTFKYSSTRGLLPTSMVDLDETRFSPRLALLWRRVFSPLLASTADDPDTQDDGDDEANPHHHEDNGGEWEVVTVGFRAIARISAVVNSVRCFFACQNRNPYNIKRPSILVTKIITRPNVIRVTVNE